MAKVTSAMIQKMRLDKDPVTMLTCTDASFAGMLDQAEVDMFLIGDSLGMVIQGDNSTLGVTMGDMVYHTRCVAKATNRALIVGDLPFGSYQKSPEQAIENAIELMAAGAQMVKLEGGVVMSDTVRFLVDRGIPVCGHIGLTPQSVHALGGFKVQGKSEEAINDLIVAAKALEQSGASAIVLELVPNDVGGRVTESINIPVIGIGAGPYCSGQVLNLYDMLDIYQGRKPKFVKNFMADSSSILDAVKAYVTEVKAGTFPGPEHCF
ncbi:MAG: 3-methyl-2-oxobutanoate hydroxymethyltransferase [Betaproteobacteria bacterium]|jgi:3-methyl-2-oxobutanoate hydroxymethyltransferase|nr:3-methyl-2-oxobutanoate hydroxymethyltransferase [Betaproteobacteria bacterium]MBT7998217.1 3-methyl-2-oxobutanoate hydroxymethyltransferase [Betaproteobacteria bacterium]